MKDFVYLYRKNNHGEPCYWCIRKSSNTTIEVQHGIVLAKAIIENFLVTMKNIDTEVQSRINKKRKEGYKYLYEIKDNVESPVEEGTFNQALYALRK